MLFRIVLAFSLVVPLLAFPSLAPRNNDSVKGNIRVPPKINDTSSKVIPDDRHPFQAPGPNDQRGPCPGLNTLANHGYLPRDGIASFADVVNAVQEGFNMDYDLGSAIAAFAIIMRGNILEGKLSIGGRSDKVQPLPKNLDGIPCGLVGHGKFEGDVSFTRQDFALGDNRNFQQDLYDQMLATQKAMGNGTDVVDAKILQKIKQDRFDDSIKRNPTFEFHEVREQFSFGEAAFVLKIFKNGTEDVLRVPVMTSFFAHQTFPQNWHRQNGSVTIDAIGAAGGDVAGDNPPPPGAKNSTGVYVADALPDDKCLFYNDLISTGTTALLGDDSNAQIKANTLQMIQIIGNLVGPGCPLPPLQGSISDCGK